MSKETTNIMNLNSISSEGTSKNRKKSWKRKLVLGTGKQLVEVIKVRNQEQGVI
jgi:hypothetical protein